MDLRPWQAPPSAGGRGVCPNSECSKCVVVCCLIVRLTTPLLQPQLVLNIAACCCLLYKPQVGGPLPGGLVLPGMSGSERKQLHIACGVVAGASLVFLDEPTTGLDSCSALSIMLFLKGMATQQGATLLASVHQPRAVIWSQLDQVGGPGGRGRGSNEFAGTRACRKVCMQAPG